MNRLQNPTTGFRDRLLRNYPGILNPGQRLSGELRDEILPEVETWR